jgi:hypothetical protein
LALPIARLDDAVVTYIGRTPKDELSLITWPKDFDPAAYLFGADRVGQGEITVVRDVLDILGASENAVDDCVAFLTETIIVPRSNRLSPRGARRENRGMRLRFF